MHHVRRNPTYLARIAVVLLVIFLTVVAWYLMPALLLFFTGVLLAVLLNMPSAWLAEHTPLPTHWALILVLLLLVTLLGLGIWWLLPRFDEQLTTLTSTIRHSVNDLEAYLAQYPWGQQVLDSLVPGADFINNNFGLQTVPRLFAMFTGVFGGFADFLVVLFLGIYLAATPRLR